MPLNLAQEIAALQRMTPKELRDQYALVFDEATNANNRVWLVRRIAWRLQALAEGDLSERAKARAAELAREADLRLIPPTLPDAPLPVTANPSPARTSTTCSRTSPTSARCVTRTKFTTANSSCPA
jgi:hypothetical protein